MAARTIYEKPLFNIVGDMFAGTGRAALPGDPGGGGSPEEVTPLEAQMAGDAKVWKRIADKHGLIEPDLARMLQPIDLSRPIEVMTDMAGGEPKRGLRRISEYGGGIPRSVRGIAGGQGHSLT